MVLFITLAQSGLFYKHITIINYDSSIVSKFGASLTDDARAVIYDRHMFIVQTTGVFAICKYFLAKSNIFRQGESLHPNWGTLKCGSEKLDLA